MVEVTWEQALACVEAMFGVHGSEGPMPNSIGAKHHFEAVLGYGNLPDAGDLRRSGYAGKETRAFLDYLQAVIDRLRPEGWGKCGTCGRAMFGVCLEPYVDEFKPFHLEDLVPGFGCRFWAPKDGEAE